MSELMFRAWDKKTNKMYFVASIDMFGKVVTLLDDRGDTLDFIERAIHNVELMQATGLEDKNGVDVYEGDIVKELVGKKTYLGDKRSKRSGIGAITYGVYYATSDDPYCSAEVEGFHIDGEIFSSNLRDYSESELEVIGNIYSYIKTLEQICNYLTKLALNNPELLERL